VDRRQFLITATTATAFASLPYIRRYAASAATSDTLGDGQTIALKVVQTILPFEHPRFPKIEPETIRKNSYEIFGLADDVRFAGALALFDNLKAWRYPPPAVIVQETALFGPPNVAHDVQRFDNSATTALKTAGRFVDLDPSDRRAYFGLWAVSALGTRRRFYQSLRAIVHATAYSNDAFWHAIGYEGPLVSRRLTS
jgi:hypothetical protein